MTPVRERDIEAVTALVRRKAGLTTASGRDVGSAMRRVMTPAQQRNSAEYVRRLAGDRAALDALLAELTIGETYFLREADQLDYLRTEVIPDLARDRGNGLIRVWSAGCASGEEAYTIAMLFHECGLGSRARILGTDIARDRLRRARRGHYGRWSFRGVADSVKRRHFRVSRNAFEVAPELRASVEFDYLNLVDDDYGAAGVVQGGTDIILCRNVLIYLDADSVARVARRLLDSLAPDGWLLMGASDPFLVGMVPCEVVATGSGVIYRRPRTGVRAGASSAGGRAAPAEPAATAGARILAPDAAPTRPAVDAAPVDGTASATAADATFETAAAVGTEAARHASERDDIARVRSLADRGLLAEAGRACAAALERHPACAELAYLQAVLLAEAGRDADAVAAARRALYLDRSLVVAQLTMSAALTRLGRVDEARRTLQAADRLLATLEPEAPVRASGGASARALMELARAHLRHLDRTAA